MYSTGSKAIKRRGYNGAFATAFYLLRWLAWFVMHQLVDRILRQQKAEREGAEKEAEKARAEARVH